ncbi:MAG: 1-deoxy-D-xylulose-5-phosphate synthase [Chloroflexi bacterium]|nr:1-deoxy-D-xylulose-5-phosphate synthase [Chloroflexota bacterium]
MTSMLDAIHGPADLKRLDDEALQTVATEIRAELVSTVPRVGGHLSSNLGVVELTLALHRVFDSPRDCIVWDVGHQAYVHKLLTGRRARLGTIRQKEGLAGFLAREESEHDLFGAGHASTSISAALGMALARKLRGELGTAVAVIGDGALTGGLAYEALNNAGAQGARMVVVLNDNGMSIAPNVGAVSRMLQRFRLAATPEAADAARRRFGAFWRDLGFSYLGPVDGHDRPLLEATLRAAAELGGPVLVHVLTTKGKGWEPAEADNEKWHGVSPSWAPKTSAPAYPAVMADALADLADADPRVVAISAAMPSGTGLNRFAARHPERFFDVGIAEAHAVTFAAGLATQGMKPVCAIYSTFLQRAYDQIIHDVCAQRLDVTFMVANAGLVGEDGRTHQGVFDLTYLRCVPNMVVMAPRDENELRRMLLTAVQHDGPAAVRYPRGAGLGVPLDPLVRPLRIGRAEVLRDGGDVAILALGTMVEPALGAADRLERQGLRATVVNARFVKPLDEELLRDLARRFDALVTVEENVVSGGFGSAVSEALTRIGYPRVAVRRLGVPDQFVEHATQGEQREALGLTAEGIARAAAGLAVRWSTSVQAKIEAARS